MRWSRVISSNAPNGSSISSRSGSKASARAMDTRCCMPPESCQGNLRSNPPRPTIAEVLGGARLALLRGHAHHLEREHHVAHHIAPGVQRRGLEHVAVGAVQPGRFGADSVDADLSAGRSHQIGNHAHQRGLAAAGRADEGDELATSDAEVDVRQGCYRRVGRLERERKAANLDGDLQRRQRSEEGSGEAATGPRCGAKSAVGSDTEVIDG